MSKTHNNTPASQVADKMAAVLRDLTHPLQKQNKLFGIGQGDDRQGNNTLEVYITEVDFGSYPKDFIALYFKNVSETCVELSMKCQHCNTQLGQFDLDSRSVNSDYLKNIAHIVLRHIHCHDIRLTKRRHNAKYSIEERDGFVIIFPGC